MKSLAIIYCCLISIAWASVYPNFRDTFTFKSLNEQRDESKDWWETASFYQIYPRSWKDSNGDGIGDLKGITDNLAYLKEIGIDATWLSPIFTSPMADFGYDIANFTEIDPTFGTMEDFDNLIKKANEVGIKIILDFVPNHSSDECEWFKKSIKKEGEYKDFYVWHPGKMINGERHPPTNWISVFRGSMWTWVEERGEYYLHQFNYKQPDFNYRNPLVVERLHDVLRFWLKKGVAGFRIDAIPHSVEVAPDSDNNYPDEPKNPNSDDPQDYGYLDHIYTVDQPETLELVYGWRKVLDDFQAENGGETRVILAETYSPIETVMKYYGNKTVNGAHIPFNFLMISWLTNDSDAYHYAETINTWLNHMPKGRTANWVIGNHDKNRVGSRFGVTRIDLFNMMLTCLPGAAITYQGEETGMLDVWISWNDTVDPQACSTNPSIYENFSRDPARTPFQWNDQHMAGFTTGDTTWLPISDDYQYVNVKVERGAGRSHLNLYKQLKRLRQQETFKKGDVDILAYNNEVLVIKRSLANDFTYIIILNIRDNFYSVDLTKHYSDLDHHLEYVAVNDRSGHRQGDVVLTNRITLLPNESIILRTQHKVTPAKTADYYKYVTN